VVFTIGHSTRSLPELIALLKAHCVDHLVDIRTIARSRKNPQFNEDTIGCDLGRAGIAYTHMAGLGGLRHAGKGSQNTGWQNASFRGYADYMQTPDFERNLEALIELARHCRPAVMCAEAVPWRCHRSLVADALLARGVDVRHIMTEKRAQPARLTSFARVSGKKVTYPGT